MLHFHQTSVCLSVRLAVAVTPSCSAVVKRRDAAPAEVVVVKLTVTKASDEGFIKLNKSKAASMLTFRLPSYPPSAFLYLSR